MSRIVIVHTVAALTTLLFLVGCTAALTGGVDKVIARADRSDPIRAAVVDALAVAEQDFAPVLGAPFSEAEREHLIEATVKFNGLGQGQSRLDLLRAAEAIAESASHITIDMPGAKAYYYNQHVVTGEVEAYQQFLEWRFPVEFADREQVSADLIARIAPLFAVDPKWHRAGISDPKIAPLSAYTSFVTYLDIGVAGRTSTLLMVTVQYWHDPENYDGWGGLRIYVMKQATGTI